MLVKINEDETNVEATINKNVTVDSPFRVSGFYNIKTASLEAIEIALASAISAINSESPTARISFFPVNLISYIIYIKTEDADVSVSVECPFENEFFQGVKNFRDEVKDIALDLVKKDLQDAYLSTILESRKEWKHLAKSELTPKDF